MTERGGQHARPIHPINPEVYMQSNAKERLPEPAAEPLSAEVEIRLGLRPVMTSKGASEPGNRWIRPGVVVSLPRHEAENLLNLGYATRV